ncbi:MAG: family 78 glycoside hydrolase catalytic domain [Erysipelotrichaceae bacterium]|nr:family 78 glycoside hydrolase catalytic domain [Erysipelotrichaceae bacterium]
MKPIRLRTEYLKDPVAISIVSPRLFWNAEGGIRQTAYQIVAEDDNGNILVDTGKVQSSSMQYKWQAQPVGWRTRVYWKVRLYDENDVPSEFAEAYFETGLPENETWTARWITGNYTVNKKQRYPVDCFRKEFSIEKSIRKARLYITACGLYEAELNGKRAGDFVMAPGHTDYRKRVQYQAYDVKELLNKGKNTLTVQLGDGWYRGSCGAMGIRNQYGTETKLLAQLEMIFEDGSTETIISDESWKWSNDGPIRFCDNKDGEIVEAFRIPSYNGQAKVTKHNVIPTCSNNVPVREHEQFKPVITTAPNGNQLLDFGQNIAGYVSFKVNAREGQKMVWRFGEMLDEEGNLTQKNIQIVKKNYTTPLQKIEYTCKEGINEYKTRFAVFGFRYTEVETEIELDPELIRSIAVYSDLEQTVSFDSSNELLNRFYEATIWSAKSNHLDIPTDCPTRERHGWTGDAQLFFTSAAYLFEFAPFARKYLHDVYDWQRKNGRLPHIAPDGGADFYMWTMNGSVGWSDVGVLIPWRYAGIYQDEEILKEYYDGMARYARFMEKRIGRTTPIFSDRIRLNQEARKYLVNMGQSYGEWAEPTEIGGGFIWQDFVKPHTEVSTAYTSYVLGLMARIAERLGHEEDAREFKRYSEGCKLAYRELVKTDEYTLDTDRQARLVRPLYMDLLDQEQTEYAKKRLIKALENYDWKLGTGFLSTPLILYVLASYDREAAYKLLENEEIPGWLSMPKNGATTIWEDWDGPKGSQGGIASLNHYSKGAVVEWLFSTMCGIRVASENHFTIAPLPGGHFSHASASYNSIYGLVKSSWKKTDKGYEYTIEIPANCTADIVLPDGKTYKQEAGTKKYKSA